MLILLLDLDMNDEDGIGGVVERLNLFYWL